jgi:hypothetical protein
MDESKETSKKAAEAVSPSKDKSPELRINMGRKEKPQLRRPIEMSRRKNKSAEPGDHKYSNKTDEAQIEEVRRELADLIAIGANASSEPTLRISSNFGKRLRREGGEVEMKVLGDFPDREVYPSFEAMLPEAGATKILQVKDAELRQASTEHHQDGVAVNTTTETFVTCDGMGGVGYGSEAKDNFAFALAQAVAELPDIHALQAGREGAKIVVDRAKEILHGMGIRYEDDLALAKGSDMTINVGANKDLSFGSTVAAAQRIEGTNDWRIATIGDSNVLVVDSKGSVKSGFGEAYRLISRGQVTSDGSAEDPPMGSYIGIGKEGREPFAKYGSRGMHAEFATVTGLERGDRIVVVSDAYLQKSPPEVLVRDIQKTAEEWKASASEKGGMYGDDATMIIINPVATA